MACADVSEDGGEAAGFDLIMDAKRNFGMRGEARKATRMVELPVVDADVLVSPDGSVRVMDAEVGTREAAAILGLSKRTIQKLCDEGVFRRIVDCRKISTREAPNQPYRIKRAAVMRMLEERA